MTDNRMALLEMAEKAGETEARRELIREVVQELMEAELDSRCGTGRHERSEARTGQRNGYRERRWDTRVGSPELSVPRPRHASCPPSYLEPRRATGQALAAVVQEAYIQGVLTRWCRRRGSSSQVSRLCATIDERVSAFLARPIAGSCPYLWLDATYVKARDGGRVVTRARVLAVGVNEAGRREVLGLAVGPAETEEFWSAFLRDLVGRGVAGVELAIPDAHQGLEQAIGPILAASWQHDTGA